jgi:2-keto-4-pentenoate hydratase/2-oxohepta-3-ene-1,7-dioic acid hydratase in catechol pathway
MLFMKPLSSVVGPDEPVVYPTGSTMVHYEGELAAVIGKTARFVSEQDALEYVLGYTCANDVSERTIQREEMTQGALFVGKAFDTFCPLGPAILVGGDPADMQLTARLNGEVKQSVNTKQMLFSVARLIAWMSKAFTLFPGDVIITGTPKGVGNIKPGDMMEVEISGIGTLRNPVVAEAR